MAARKGAERSPQGGGGAAGGGGYNFQAQATAFIYTHVLGGRPLVFADNHSPVPLAVSAESDGPGDDVRVECEDGIVVEIQVKRGLRANITFWTAVTELIEGLVDEPELLAVLLVNSTTSGTIKENFRRGVQRLADGCTDGLDGITKELQSKLGELGIDPSILKRLTVTVRDFHDGSTGHENALLMLDGIAQDPPAAWTALQNDGHYLIENRGRRRGEDLARQLSVRGGGISAEASQPLAVGQAYRDWLEETTSRFRVPGAAVSLTIEEAWAELEVWDNSDDASSPEKQTLEERITAYQEWSRLGLRDRITSGDGTFDAKHLMMAGNRLVVVAGPGAGKSTLQRRLAHGLSRDGANVALVRLPLVAGRIVDGATLEEAIIDVAASGSGLRRDALTAVLGSPDYLLADSLDECGAAREAVVEQLAVWAAGRPNCRVVVSTRPVGYDSALLPGWRHLELLPFDEEAARAHAGNLLCELGYGVEPAEDAVDKFMRSVAANDTAKRAAGNPLLLGFLVLLFADGEPFGRRRAELYGQIMGQVLAREARSGFSEALTRATTERALEILAWHLQGEPMLSSEEAVERLGRALEVELRLPPLAARDQAEACLAFWQERGMVERLTAGSRETLVFTHAGLGEYAAARYASSLDPGEMRAWVIEVLYNPRWQEVLLLAAGTGAERGVIEALLDLYDPEDPIGRGLELAARALSEVAEPPEDFAARVAEAIRDRLKGDTPAAVFAAAESALSLAREAPQVLFQAIKPLLSHTQFATSVAFMRLLLECGQEYVDPDAVRKVLEELMEPNEGERELPQRRNGFFVWGLQDQIAYLGIKKLLHSRPGLETEELIERVMSGGSLISSGTHIKLLQDLHDFGYEDMVDRIEGKQRYKRLPKKFWSAEDRREANEENIKRDRRFLEIVLDVSEGDGGETSGPLAPAEAPTVAALVQGLKLGEFPAPTWRLMVYGDSDTVRAVFEGGAAVIGIDFERLASEAAGLITYLDQIDPGAQIYIGLLGDLPKVPAKPDWHKAAGAGLAAEDLVRGLRHPSEAIAINASQLIAYGGGAPDAKVLVMNALEDAPEHTYRAVALLAARVWDEEAMLENLLPILAGGVTQDNHWLLLAVATLSSAVDDERARETLVRGLLSEDPTVATKLAETMTKADPAEFPLFRAATSDLEGILEHWTERGTTCRKHRGTIHGDRCPRCSEIPSSPRAALVSLLSEADRISLTYLLNLCDDRRSDVRQVASAQAATLAARTSVLPMLIEKIGAGKVPGPVLKEALTLPPEQLRAASEQLLALLSSPSAEFRRQVVGALATPGWISHAEATTHAEAALSDREAAVRDRAVDTLRTLRERA